MFTDCESENESKFYSIFSRAFSLVSSFQLFTPALRPLCSKRTETFFSPSLQSTPSDAFRLSSHAAASFVVSGGRVHVVFLPASFPSISHFFSDRVPVAARLRRHRRCPRRRHQSHHSLYYRPYHAHSTL